MKKSILYIVLAIFTLLCAGSAKAMDGFRISHLKSEMLVNPKGIDVRLPRLSWQIISEQRGVEQQAYQVLVASSPVKLARNEGDLWNSGKVVSGQSLHVHYAGKPLKSRQEVYWKVKVWTNLGEGDWSTPAFFSMVLLGSSDWSGQWIGLDKAMPWDSVSKFARLSARYFR
ncbi:MAG TPA: alpha-rhamnosidase, partial [Chitinophagaceae bacterium]